MTPRLGAVAVVIRDDEVLLIKRGQEPNKGKWAFPGGGVELGETALEAAARELFEETGIIGTALGYLTNVDIILYDDQGEVSFHCLLAAVTCRYESGEPIAGDDATDARWVKIAEVKDLDTSGNVQAVIKCATS